MTDLNRIAGAVQWRTFGESLALASPPLIVLGICIGLADRNGGFSPTVSYPASLLALVLLVSVALSGRWRLLSRPALIAVLALTAFTALSFLSIAWAAAPASAWHGANLTLLYLVAFTLLAAWAVTAQPAAYLLLSFAGALTVLGAIAIVSGIQAADPESGPLYYNRLSLPIGYPNATAALFGMGAWVALTLSSHAWLSRAFRGTAIGLAVALTQLDLLAQSRGAVFTTPIVVVVFVVLATRRYLALLPLAIVAIASAPIAPTLGDLYDARTAAAQHDALRAAGVTIVLSAIVAGVGAALILPRTDRLPSPSPRRRTALRAALGAAAIVAVLATAAFGSVDSRASRAWHQFRHEADTSGSTHLVGLGSNRYDVWRVALIEFKQHPLFGIGTDNFAVPYLERRRSSEQPDYPHSLPIRLLSQTGLLGTAIFAVFLVSALVAALRREASPERGVAVAAVVAFVAWMLHASVDWLWELPATGLTALTLLGLAVGLGPARVSAPAFRLARGKRTTVIACGGVVAVAAGLSLAFPWASARYQKSGVSAWRVDPGTAYARLDRAAQLNPLDDQSYVLAGAIASRRHDYVRMRESFRRAIDRNRLNWYSHLELAVALSNTGDPAAARRAIGRALKLNPREPVIRLVSKQLHAGETVDPASVDEALLEQIEGL